MVWGTSSPLLRGPAPGLGEPSEGMQGIRRPAGRRNGVTVQLSHPLPLSCTCATSLEGKRGGSQNLSTNLYSWASELRLQIRQPIRKGQACSPNTPTGGAHTVVPNTANWHRTSGDSATHQGVLGHACVGGRWLVTVTENRWSLVPRSHEC